MTMEDKSPNPVRLAREIMQYHKEKHPYGRNYAVRVRLGHAEIQDVTAVAEILSSIKELGYEVVKRNK